MKTLVYNSDNFKTTWDITTRNFIPMPLEMKKFLEEIVAICKKYNLSISHEDGQGNFIVEEYIQDCCLSNVLKLNEIDPDTLFCFIGWNDNHKTKF